MEKVGINITKSQISQYAVIDGPGTYIVKATGQNNLYSKEKNVNLGKDSYLVNLKAIEGRKVDSVLTAFGKEEAIDLVHMRNLTMVYSAIVNDGAKVPDLPLRDQEVKISVEWAIDRATGEQLTDDNGDFILNIRQMIVPPASKPKLFKFDINKEIAVKAQRESHEFIPPDAVEVPVEKVF